MTRLAKFGAGASLFPLGVLFTIEMLDQATQSAFNILTPNIRDAFHLTNAGILLIVAIAGAAALACTLPVAFLADRANRVRIALAGALIGAAFSIGLGLSQGIIVATIMLVGISMGQAVIFPTHNSLLADYYPVPARPRVYSAHRSGISVGVIVGVLLGAGLAALFTWRAPFFFFAAPIVLTVIVGWRLREPPRGRHEQLALSEQMLASERGEAAPLDDTPPATVDVPDTPAEAPPSLGESWRTVWKIGVLRRIFIALPFLAAAIAGFASLASLQYQETFHLDAVQRAYLIAPTEIFDIAGLAVGAVVATRLARRDIGLVFRMLAVASVVAAAFAVLFALAPNVPLAFVGNAGIVAALAVVGPGVLASLSIAIPPRVRAVGFSIGALFVLPGLLVLPVVGAVGDAIGFRYGLLILVPVFVLGGLIVSSAGGLIASDVRDVWTSMRTRTQMLMDRQAGQLPLLAVRELNVGYDGVVVLADMAIEVGEGEIVALVGTNGAGKSTLLRAIGGVVEADHGAIVFDGRDITHLPPDEIARLGVAQVPGGEGIFPNLRVEDNLRVAAWQGRRRGERDVDMIQEALAAFPTLASRRDERAANLSGGQQQMLALAMATITRPKLFLIDELSLGLSPIVVEQLLGAIESMRQAGTAILLVEQSMNVAVAVADRVYVMETGVVRFSGSAAELAAHPELLWSVYLQKASATLGASTVPAPATADVRAQLSVRGVSLSFGGNAALNDVSLHADHGEIVGIIGPNGAGKTTLFDVVSGFLRPDSGLVELAGDDVTHRTASARARLGLGRSFQDSRLFSALTVRDALAVSLERFTDVHDPFNAMLRLPLQVRTEAAVRERVDELLDMFGLDRYADNLVSELSTGSRRLVDLAAVVAHQPSVVLLDEPSSGVAQREVEAMVGLLRSVRDRLDATLLVVEHDIAFIAELADRLVAMDRGAVLVDGPPTAVLESPLVGEAFLGSDPLALFALGCHRHHHCDDHEHGGGPGMSDSDAGPERAGRPWPKVGLLRRAGPVVLIVAALVAAGVSATVHENNGTTQANAPSPGAGQQHGASTVPLTYQAAAKLGKTAAYDWGPRCDHHTGRLKIPSVYAPPCVPVPSAGSSNGGATASGVTNTTVNIVYYQMQPGGLASTISAAAGTNAQALATAQAYVAMFNKVYELYGRHVNLIPFTASGADTDPVAAHADAVTVAQQLHAFASIGGPGETNAYEDELARLHVLCMACGDSSTNGQIQQNAPFQWANLPTADTSLNETVGYLLSKLNGKDAVWAGEPAFHTKKRKFIVVSETSEPPAPGYAELNASLTKKLTVGHANMADPTTLSYTLDLTTLPTQAATIAEKLKASGATSVVFAGDPIMPIYLTKACASIGYFPEWIITGIVLTDTAALGRYYDQSEWSHAFGVTSLGVPVPVNAGDADHLYHWWYGANAQPASLAAPAIIPPIQQVFAGMQLAGPDLTSSTFTAGLFRAPPTGGGPTTPLLAYGYQGAAPRPSYSSPADYTFLWYDATAKGPDEEGTVGTGLMRYVNGGARYRAGTVPVGPVPMFQVAGSVTSYASPPDRAPTYPAWPGSPAASGAG